MISCLGFILEDMKMCTIESEKVIILLTNFVLQNVEQIKAKIPNHEKLFDSSIYALFCLRYEFLTEVSVLVAQKSGLLQETVSHKYFHEAV